MEFPKGPIGDLHYCHIDGTKKNWYGNFFFPDVCLHPLVSAKNSKNQPNPLFFEYEKVKMKTYTKDDSLDLPPGSCIKT